MEGFRITQKILVRLYTIMYDINRNLFQSEKFFKKYFFFQPTMWSLFSCLVSVCPYIYSFVRLENKGDLMGHYKY